MTQKSSKTSILRFEKGTNSIFDPKIIENIDFAVRKRYQLDFWPKNRRKQRFCGSKEVLHHGAHIYPGLPCKQHAAVMSKIVDKRLNKLETSLQDILENFKVEQKISEDRIVKLASEIKESQSNSHLKSIEMRLNEHLKYIDAQNGKRIKELEVLKGEISSSRSKGK